MKPKYKVNDYVKMKEELPDSFGLLNDESPKVFKIEKIRKYGNEVYYDLEGVHDFWPEKLIKCRMVEQRK